jgi:NADH-quinone oxidoreductase subunit N
MESFLGYWLQDLQRQLVEDLLGFAPELAICAGIVLLLALRLFSRLDRLHMRSLALLVTLCAFGLSVNQWRSLHADPGAVGATLDQPGSIFGGMLVYDSLTVYLRLFLYGFVTLVVWLSMLTGIPDREDSADFYCLLLGATLGMSLMASANHLLMVFIGVEMASLPSYALAGFLKGRRQSSEAALKYVVYGGGAAGIMLYGISLLAGKFGTGYLPDVALGFAGLIRQGQQGGATDIDTIVLLGTLFLLVGIAFKLAAVPFHFWCPDVFEGASAEVAAFLSVASKGAALALLGRIVLNLAGLSGSLRNDELWLQMARYMVPGLAFFAALTATFGNIAAYLQTNLKRLLAYSTIAHAGYMMMGIATVTAGGMSAVLFYLPVYLFMNLGAFAIVAFFRNQTGSEELDTYKGYVQRAPVMVVALACFLFSLIGVPPLAGFFAKFQIFAQLFDAGNLYSDKAPSLSWVMYGLLVIGGINSVISLVYYINILRVMILEKPPEADIAVAPQRRPAELGSSIYSFLLAVALFGLLLPWGGYFDLGKWSQQGVDRFIPARIVAVRPSGPSSRPPPAQGGGGRRQPAPR